MRQGSLVDRLERVPSSKKAPPHAANQLDTVARALRAVTDKTERNIGAEVLSSGEQRPNNDNEPELPQILQHPPTGLTGAKKIETGSSRGQALAPAILALALLGIAVLMSASMIDFARLPGLSILDDKPRPRLIPQAQKPLSLATGLNPQATSLEDNFVSTETPAAPPLSLDELALLERCETLIAGGNMETARQELARAASAGSLNARFALAETFDPNVLAAWGMRERIADVGAARALYEQALAAGDARAAPRLGGLQASP